MLCLAHGRFPTLGDRSSTPFPAVILSPVVGCDRVIRPGAGQMVVEYTHGNSPRFAEVAAGLTNGTQEAVITVVQLVGDDLTAQGGGGGVGNCESKMHDMNGPHEDIWVYGMPCLPLLEGHSLEMVRLTVFNVEVEVSADGSRVSHSAHLLWEYYGRGRMP